MKRKEPTWTSLVMELLERQDDFMTVEMIIESLGGQLTGANRNRIYAALFHLRKHRAVDCVVEPDGKAWWYSTSKEDDRIRTVLERVLEPPGNRKRRKKVKL